MSSATKKRIVLRETAQDTFTPSSSQFIARITAGRGNNLHEVVTETDETFLVSMPTKVAEDGILNSVNALVFQYRRTVWMKRGDYVVCEHINEGDKVRAEIVHVFADVRDIDELIRNGLFPQHFIDTDDALKKSIKAAENTRSKPTIDDDLLPPSESESSESNDEKSSCEEDDTDEHRTKQICNPNREKGIFGD